MLVAQMHQLYILELLTELGKCIDSSSYVCATGLPTSVITLLTKPINYNDDLDLIKNNVTVANVPSDLLIRERRSVFDWMKMNSSQLGNNYISSVDRYYRKNE
eukprot:GSMAST32.ASY1.ANO1.1420.1 assembled CDS